MLIKTIEIERKNLDLIQWQKYFVPAGTQKQRLQLQSDSINDGRAKNGLEDNKRFLLFHSFQRMLNDVDYNLKYNFVAKSRNFSSFTSFYLKKKKK